MSDKERFVATEKYSMGPNMRRLMENPDDEDCKLLKEAFLQTGVKLDFVDCEVKKDEQIPSKESLLNRTLRSLAENEEKE